MPTEEHKVDGTNLLARVKEIVHEGNVRRIIIKNEQGHSLLEIPLTIGVVGAVSDAGVGRDRRDRGPHRTVHTRRRERPSAGVTGGIATAAGHRTRSMPIGAARDRATPA